MHDRKSTYLLKLQGRFNVFAMYLSANVYFYLAHNNSIIQNYYHMGQEKKIATPPPPMINVANCTSIVHTT